MRKSIVYFVAKEARLTKKSRLKYKSCIDLWQYVNLANSYKKTAIRTDDDCSINIDMPDSLMHSLISHDSHSCVDIPDEK